MQNIVILVLYAMYKKREQEKDIQQNQQKTSLLSQLQQLPLAHTAGAFSLGALLGVIAGRILHKKNPEKAVKILESFPIIFSTSVYIISRVPQVRTHGDIIIIHLLQSLH